MIKSKLNPFYHQMGAENIEAFQPASLQDTHTSPPQGFLGLSCHTKFPTNYNLLFATVQGGKGMALLKLISLSFAV